MSDALSPKEVDAHRAPKWSFWNARVSLRLLRFERASFGGALRDAMSWESLEGPVGMNLALRTMTVKMTGTGVGDCLFRMALN